MASRYKEMATSAPASSTHPNTHLPGLLADFQLVLSPEFTFYTGSHVETIALCQGWCTQTPREETQVSSVNCLACPWLQTAFSQDRVAK